MDEAAEGCVATAAALTNRTTVRQLVAAFEQTERDVLAAFATVRAAEKRLNDVFTLGGERPFRVNAADCHHSDDWERPDVAMAKLRRKAWEVIVDRLEIKRAMSCERARLLDEHLAKGEPDPITEATVNAFVRRFAEGLDEMFEAAVVEVFDWIRPRDHETHRGGYKTNQKHARLEIGPSVILTGMVESGHGRGRFRVAYGWGHGTSPGQRLTALWNVFSMLDGQGIGPKTAQSPLQDAIETSPDGSFDTLYFKGRGHKNRNIHLTFKRPDLLKRFNQIAGGKRLRPSEGSTR